MGIRRSPTLSLRAAWLALLLLSAASAAVIAGPLPAPDPVAVRLAALHLPEPLVAIGPTNAAEDAALFAAASRYESRTRVDDFSALTGFLQAYPKSAWRVAVLADLGLDYRHYGYFSRALAAFEQAWREGRNAADRRARALVDRAIGELVRLDAAFGYRDRLAALLREIGDRPVSGPATALVQLGREMLWVMEADPKHLYICGPTALKMLLLARHVPYAQVDSELGTGRRREGHEPR
jgi:hypothetical protein